LPQNIVLLLIYGNFHIHWNNYVVYKQYKWDWLKGERYKVRMKKFGYY
jgi:hypothetical protein